MYLRLVVLCTLISSSVPAQPAPAVPGRRWLVSVGISNYPDRQKLPNASRDAAAVTRLLLAQHGFAQIGELLEPKARKADISEVLDGPLRSSVREADTVMFFFAGHGIQTVGGRPAIVTLDEGDAGVWPLEELLDKLNRLPAKDVIVVIDSCQAGVDIDQPIKRAERDAGRQLRTRQLITSASKDQNARDGGGRGNSLFVSRLLYGLETGRCDLDFDGVCTVSEAVTYVRKDIFEITNGDQVPGLRRFGSDSGGDVRFELSFRAAQMYTRLRDTDDDIALERFINNHPGTAYADEARLRLREIRIDKLRKNQLRVPDPGVYRGEYPGNRITSTKDGQVYAWIPPKQTGSPANDRADALQSGFWIGQTEVTVDAYNSFSPVLPRAPGYNPRWNRRDEPIVNVSWADAWRYCRWTGGKLPTEREWSYAAQADAADGSEYPWGKGFSFELANLAGRMKRNRDADTTPATGDTWDYTAPAMSFDTNGWQLKNVIGNVAEWTQPDLPESSPENVKTTAAPSAPTRVVARGGSFADPPNRVSLSTQWQVEPLADNRIGFRCVIVPDQTLTSGVTATIAEKKEGSP
jgi:hypothetical protein